MMENINDVENIDNKLKQKIRIQITKSENIRFISHLEYARTIERAIRRSNLPIAYSRGFNPHMRFSLASALGVSIRSNAEFTELELEPNAKIDLEESMIKLDNNLPEGIKVIKADIVSKDTKKLMAQAGGADYTVILPFEEFDLAKQIEAYNNSETAFFKKIKPKSKGRLFKDLDAKLFVPSIKGEKLNANEVKLQFSVKISVFGSMKATELIAILKKDFGFKIELEKADILREDLYAVDENGNKKPLIEAQYMAK